MQNPDKLRELASWYREFAEQAANPAISDGRAHIADDLEREAERIDHEFTPPAGDAAATEQRASQPAEVSDDLNLHRHVRDAYRHAMQERCNEREAFHRAVDLLLKQKPDADPASAGHVVAVMLANEP